MARRSGLGKGLGALIPSDLANPSDDASLRELQVSQIEPNQHQPRDREPAIAHVRRLATGHTDSIARSHNRMP